MDTTEPATAKQKNYIAVLQERLCWTSEQTAVYAHEQNIDLVAMTKAQASTMISDMKRMLGAPPSH